MSGIQRQIDPDFKVGCFKKGNCHYAPIRYTVFNLSHHTYFSRQLRCKDCKPVGPDGKVKLVDIKLMNPGAYDKVLEGMGLKKRANPAAGVRTGVEGIQ